MSLLRLALLWLVMAALPLQGFAAASMLFCGPSGHASAAQQDSHDHASHSQDGGHKHDAAHADTASSQPQEGGPQTGAATVDDGHSCPICASCCNLVALSETPALHLSTDAPRSPPLEGPSRVLTRDAPTPDKPPRA